jgi:AraC-like DNA-binding protein
MIMSILPGSVACKLLPIPDLSKLIMILIYELPEDLPAAVRELITDRTLNSIPGTRPFLVKLPKESRDKQRALDMFIKAGISFSKDPKEIWAVQIRQAVIEMLDKEEMNYNCSIFLSERLKRNYAYLSAVFSEYFGHTIEQYIISCKIEKAKELLNAGDLKISEIALFLKYKSVAHFSNQFKTVEGISPRVYKQHLDDNVS